MFVGGTGVLVGGTGVLVGGTGVFVGGTAVLVGGAGVFVGGASVARGNRLNRSLDYGFDSGRYCSLFFEPGLDGSFYVWRGHGSTRGRNGCTCGRSGLLCPTTGDNPEHNNQARQHQCYGKFHIIASPGQRPNDSTVPRLLPHVHPDRAALKSQLGFRQVKGGHLRKTLIQLEERDSVYGVYPSSSAFLKSRLAELSFPRA